MLDLPDVRKLRVLREVAARGTIAAAAEALGMTPSAASQQLATLERQAGSDLVVRTGRSVRLTPTALRLVEHTERVLQHLEAARVDLSTSPDDISGELHMAAFATAIHSLVAPSLAPLRDAYPGLGVGIIERNTEDALAALTTGTIDLAVTFDYDLLPSPAPVGAALELLLEEPVYVALPASMADDEDVAVTLSSLADERWIAPLDGTSCHTFVTRACNRAGFEPHFWALSGDFGTIAKLVSVGAGVALIPALGCRDMPEGVALRALDHDVVRRIHVATRAGSANHPGIQAVVAELRHAARIAQHDLCRITPVR